MAEGPDAPTSGNILEDESGKFYALVHPGGPKGITSRKPEMRRQDAEALPAEGYAVVFFPKLTTFGQAMMNFPRISETFSQTPEAAIVKFMDGIIKSEKWETYFDAGHRVRKVRVIDLGDAESGNL
jgi:hypothetical protein